MLRAEKETVLAELQEQLADCQSLVLTDYRGLRAAELGELRHRLREAGVEFHIVKNNLLLRALEAQGVELTPELNEALLGPTAIAYTSTDEITLPMKLVHDSSKDHDQLQIKCGLLDNRFVPPAEVQELAKLPGRTEMMAMIAGAVQSPVTGILSLLRTMIGNIVSGIDQIAKQKDAEAESAPDA